MQEIFNFIGQIISSIAWPITVLIVLFCVKNPLIRLLEKITKIKYKDAEAEFGREFEKVKVEAENSDLKLIKVGRSKTSNKTLSEEVTEIATISPEAAIPFAWTKIESALQKAVERTTPKEEIKYFNKSIKYLNIKEKMSSKTYEIINSLRELRNKIIHDNNNTKVSYQDAIEYGKMAELLISNINEIKS